MTPFAAVPVIDERATQRLLTELAPRIVRVVRAVLGGGHSELEDVQQQALLAFVQALPSFRGECEVRHFASRIAARTALLAARRTRTARARRDDGVEVDDLVTGDAPQHEDAMQHRRQELLRDLLAQLAPEQAETLTLRVVLGWSLPEIAAATHAPLNTVRSRIRLAKNALRSAIEHDPVLSADLT
jgi:RNA polymerase sigma-70 factor (ECF subfamily)